MDIKIGKYWLSSDSRNYIISKPPQKDKRGIKFYPNQTYYSTIPNAINGLLEILLKKSDVTTLTELLNEHRELTRSLSEAFKGIEGGK